ncbi:MAG TPA: mucoidy inhibitor-like protein, partial [Cytophagales bacterium]|nr:mucoidy inhibitor-like protein [Cytophagales bacterium]
MKKFSIIIILLSLLSDTWATEQEIRVKAELKEANVYLTSAKLSVTAEALIVPGANTVVLENLPNNLNPETIQLNAKGDFVILGVQFANNYLKEMKKNQQAEKLTDSLERLSDKMEILNGKGLVLEKEETMISSNNALSGTETGFKVDELVKLADFYRKRLGQITEEKIKLKQQKKELQKQIDKVSAQLNELNQPSNAASGELRINVSSKNTVSASFNCEFMVFNAGWEPLYDIKAKNTNSPIQLIFKAKVYQNTGMDWKNVKLKLSTTNPLLGGDKPELSPWYLDFYTPPLYNFRAKTMATP